MRIGLDGGGPSSNSFSLPFEKTIALFSRHFFHNIQGIRPDVSERAFLQNFAIFLTANYS
jgi:hypothetical protein